VSSDFTRIRCVSAHYKSKWQRSIAVQSTARSSILRRKYLRITSRATSGSIFVASFLCQSVNKYNRLTSASNWLTMIFYQCIGLFLFPKFIHGFVLVTKVLSLPRHARFPPLSNSVSASETNEASLRSLTFCNFPKDQGTQHP
jgi:cellulose synthase/poly-beta-1,6-N-acetylglucosamine synthase-like glycosyltransferase